MIVRDLKMKNFTKDDLKAGMLVMYRDCRLRLVENSKQGLFLTSKDFYKPIECYNDDLTEVDADCEGMDIVEVYDLRETPISIKSLLSTDGRKLLCKRKEVKKVTMKELHDLLGYEVEIVEG